MVRMFVSINPGTSLKMGYLGSKTRLIGQILEKYCVCSRGHIFSPIIMTFGQNVCLDKMSDEFENVKTRSLGQMLKIPYVCSRGHTFSPISMELDQHVCRDEIPYKFETMSCRVKN